MKRHSSLLLMVLGLALVFAPIAWAATGSRTPPRVYDRSPGASISAALTTATGIAISPLLGTGAYGAYQWVTAEDSAARAELPWYAQPKFWVPALLIVGLAALKDTVGPAIPPMLKKPLDIIDVAENKFSGLIAAGAVVPFAMDAISKMIVESAAQAGAAGVAPTGLAMIQILGVNWAPFLNILMIPLGVAIFLVVWMASHAINVLVLLSPWGGVDAALKGARTALLGLLTVTAYINPVVGAFLSVAVIIFAYFVAGWAFRLTVFGAIVSWEFFTRRRSRFVLSGSGDRLFTSSAFAGVPVRTYGRLIRRDTGELEFVYRPWLVMQPRMAPVPAPRSNLAVGSGLFFSIVMIEEGAALFVLPPRYRGHEERLAEAYGLAAGVRPAGLRKAWSSFRELVGGRAAPAPALATPAG